MSSTLLPKSSQLISVSEYSSIGPVVRSNGSRPRGFYHLLQQGYYRRAPLCIPAVSYDVFESWKHTSSLLQAYATVQADATVHADIFKPTKFGGKYTATLIPGDGIGAEVAESVKTIFKADNVPIEWEQIDVSGVESGNKQSEDLFRESIASLKRNKLGLKGSVDASLGDEVLIQLQVYCTRRWNALDTNPLTLL